MPIPGEEKVRMKNASIALLTVAALAISAPLQIHAQVTLIAKGTLTSSPAGSYADLSGLKGTLENGVRANLLGGLGSGIAHVSGDEFLALPDRGPNAVGFDSAIDDTASYIDRFHTVRMHLQSNPGGRFHSPSLRNSRPRPCSAASLSLSTGLALPRKIAGSSTTLRAGPTTSIPTEPPATHAMRDLIPKASACPTMASAYSFPMNMDPTSINSRASVDSACAPSGCQRNSM